MSMCVCVCVCMRVRACVSMRLVVCVYMCIYSELVNSDLRDTERKRKMGPKPKGVCGEGGVT